MGATKAWWLAALDPRVKTTIDVCCLTDYESLIEAHGLSGHSVYYYVPSLLKQFDTTQINELIVPRPHLSVNGRNDSLTPPEGVIKIRDHLLPLYRKYGRGQAHGRLMADSILRFKLFHLRCSPVRVGRCFTRRRARESHLDAQL
jgi:hypothetical protein